MVNVGFATNHNTLLCNSDLTENNTNDRTLPANGTWVTWSYDCVIPTNATPGAYDILGALRSASNWGTVLDDTRTGANTIDFAAGAWKTRLLTVNAIQPTARLATDTVTPTSVSVGTAFTVDTQVRVETTLAKYVGLSISFPDLDDAASAGTSYSTADGTVTTDTLTATWPVNQNYAPAGADD